MSEVLSGPFPSIPEDNHSSHQSQTAPRSRSVHPTSLQKSNSKGQTYSSKKISRKNFQVDEEMSYLTKSV